MSPGCLSEEKCLYFSLLNFVIVHLIAPQLNALFQRSVHRVTCVKIVTQLGRDLVKLALRKNDRQADAVAIGLVSVWHPCGFWEGTNNLEIPTEPASSPGHVRIPVPWVLEHSPKPLLGRWSQTPQPGPPAP